jgi:hypothetical protein
MHTMKKFLFFFPLEVGGFVIGEWKGGEKEHILKGGRGSLEFFFVRKEKTQNIGILLLFLVFVGGNVLGSCLGAGP